MQTRSPSPPRRRTRRFELSWNKCENDQAIRRRSGRQIVGLIDDERRQRHRPVSGGRHQRPLLIAFGLTATFMIVEVIAGFATRVQTRSPDLCECGQHHPETLRAGRPPRLETNVGIDRNRRRVLRSKHSERFYRNSRRCGSVGLSERANSRNTFSGRLNIRRYAPEHSSCRERNRVLASRRSRVCNNRRKMRISAAGKSKGFVSMRSSSNVVTDTTTCQRSNDSVMHRYYTMSVLPAEGRT